MGPGLAAPDKSASPFDLAAEIRVAAPHPRSLFSNSECLDPVQRPKN